MQSALPVSGIWTDANVEKSRARRACDRCRNLKVRCRLSDDNPDGPCERCISTKSYCNGALPRHDRTVPLTRLKALEEELAALKASLAASLPCNQTTLAQQEENISGSRAGLLPETSSPPDAPRTVHSREGIVFGQRSVNEDLHQSGNVLQKRPLVNVQRDNDEMIPVGKRLHISIDSTMSLEQQHQEHAPPTPQSQSYTSNVGRRDFNEFNAQSESAFPSRAASLEGSSHERCDTWSSPDVIDQGLLTLSFAVELFNCYAEKLAVCIPMVPVQTGTDAQIIRRTRPLFFLAILVVGSGVKQPQLQKQLFQEFDRILVERHIQGGERSLDAIQALQVSVLWPTQQSRIQLNTRITFIITMAVDLGLDKKQFYRSEEGNQRKHATGEIYNNEGDISIEERRTWLSCYYLGVSASIAFRRQSLTRWSSYIAESMRILTSPPNASEFNKQLCQWVTLTHICEDISVALGINEPQVQYGEHVMEQHEFFSDCRRRLEDWNSKLPLESLSMTLRLYECSVAIFMREIILRWNTSGNFTSPYIDSLARGGEAFSVEQLNSMERGCFDECLNAIYNMFDMFLEIGKETLSTLPMFSISRLVYAVLVLMKISLLVKDRRLLRGGLSKTQILLYLNELMRTLEQAGPNGTFRPALMFRATLRIFLKWFQDQYKISATTDPSSVVSNSPARLAQGSHHDDRNYRYGCPDPVNGFVCPIQKNSAENKESADSLKSLHPIRSKSLSRRIVDGSDLLGGGRQAEGHPTSQSNPLSEIGVDRSTITYSHHELSQQRHRKGIERRSINPDIVDRSSSTGNSIESADAQVSQPWNPVLSSNADSMAFGWPLTEGEVPLDILSGQTMNDVEIALEDWNPEFFPYFEILLGQE